jgi:hypothetical protein
MFPDASGMIPSKLRNISVLQGMIRRGLWNIQSQVRIIPESAGMIRRSTVMLRELAGMTPRPTGMLRISERMSREARGAARGSGRSYCRGLELFRAGRSSRFSCHPMARA